MFAHLYLKLYLALVFHFFPYAQETFVKSLSPLKKSKPKSNMLIKMLKRMISISLVPIYSCLCLSSMKFVKHMNRKLHSMMVHSLNIYNLFVRIPLKGLNRPKIIIDNKLKLLNIITWREGQGSTRKAVNTKTPLLKILLINHIRSHFDRILTPSYSRPHLFLNLNVSNSYNDLNMMIQKYSSGIKTNVITIKNIDNP